MMHECQIKKQVDDFAWTEQYIIWCECHSSSRQIWRPGDPEFVCPEEVKHERENNLSPTDE